MVAVLPHVLHALELPADEPGLPARPVPVPVWDGTPIRPTVATIDLGALARNYRAIRREAGVAEVLAVVKADSYGHGAVACSRVLEREGASLLGVALIEEGLELRQAGIGTRMLVLGGAYGDRYDLLLGYDLTPLVFRREQLEGLSAAARTLGRRPRVHVKLDTGMGRIGVQPGELLAFAEAALALGIEVEGLASHFANADLADHEQTRRQLATFNEAVAALAGRGFHPRYLHLANSAASVSVGEARGTLVRPGVMLYGLYPGERFRPMIDLQPVLRWSSEVSHVKEVAAGTAISYGSRWVASRPSRIATVPVGYADGFDRRLTNQGEMLVRGRRARVAGTVCMDQTMFDVTDIPGVEVGDEVVLIGRQGDDAITADEVAARCGTIHYETLCGIGARVPRRFVGG
jgi:alanine racemase